MTPSLAPDPLSGLDLDALRFDERGLLPVVVQDRASGDVVMVAYANREALEHTRASRLAHFYSRSRQQLWKKGETSGHLLHVHSAAADCDLDTLVLQVDPDGPACHRGTRTCFEHSPGRLQLGWLTEIVKARRAGGGDASYTVQLLGQGLERIAQKVGEEAVETVIAALGAQRSGPREMVAETADLLYHLVVLLEALDVDPLVVAEELRTRHQERTSHAKTPGKSP